MPDAPGRRPPAPVTVEAPPVRGGWLAHHWLDLVFVHWTVDPAKVVPLLPPGTRPDEHDGQAFVGLVAFRLVGSRPGRRGPVVPWLGTFLETNVRLYTVDDDGRRGVVFRSLDAARLVPVLVARASLRLPYVWARMTAAREGDVLRYASRRWWPGAAATRLAARIGEPIAQPTDLEHALTARWGLHTRAWGRTWFVPNEHPAWPLHRAELLHLDDELVAAGGLPVPDAPPVSVLYSPGVPVVFGTPIPVGTR